MLLPTPAGDLDCWKSVGRRRFLAFACAYGRLSLIERRRQEAFSCFCLRLREIWIVGNMHGKEAI